MTETTFETPMGEARLYICPKCGHHWLEFCDSDQHPEHCPECGQLLHDDEIETQNDQVPMEDKSQMYRFTITLGDWSLDGHYIYVDYNVLSSAPLEQVREAHFHIKEVTGVDIEEIFEDKDYLTFSEIRILRKLGWKRAITPASLGGRMFVEPDDVADLWLFPVEKGGSLHRDTSCL